jgi:sugar phosphate isomerase/epimerase
LKIYVLATDIENAGDPLTLKVLRTASRLGIRRYRVKHWLYDLKKPIEPQLAEFRRRVADLAKLNKELNLVGTLQNHSGVNNAGAPVWDIWEMIHSLDRGQMGIQFDIGHATLEGGLSWPLQARLMEPYFATVSVKDFVWKRTDRGAWQSAWVPLGEGMVRRDFFDWLKKTAFRGPVSQHFEYELGSGKEKLAAMKRDLGTLRQWLSA